tara:strand:+ start:575 stop:730 length:156 start_codon:yes stop_codon:yes gene_type:complete
MERYCAFADDYPSWMDHEEGEREYQDALPDLSEFDPSPEEFAEASLGVEPE